MRRLRFLPLLALCGCNYLSGGSSCDKAKLESLAGELDELPPDEAVGHVWPGVQDACGESLTNAAAYTYDPPEPHPATATVFQPDAAWQRMVFAACPEWEEVAIARADAAADQRALVVYVGCGFERFGVLSREEVSGHTSPGIVTWAMHHHFIDLGVDPDAARTITRALFGLEQRNAMLSLLPGNVQLPIARGAPIPEGVPVGLGRNELVFQDRQIAAIRNGSLDPVDTQQLLVPMLYEAMAEEADRSKQFAEDRGEAWESRVLLVADRETTFDALVKVMYTAGRADFRHYSLVVQSHNGLGINAIDLDPPAFAPMGLTTRSGPASPPPSFARDPELRPDDRFSGYMNVPDEVVEEEPPPEDDGEDDDGDIARYKGEEGHMGKPTAKNKKGLYAMKGPKDAIPQMARNFDPDMMARNAGLLSDAPFDFSAPVVTVELTPTSYSMGRGRKAGKDPVEVADTEDDFAALASFVKGARDADPELAALVISASGDTRVARLVAAIDAARGTDCAADGQGCLVPRVIIHGEHAHEHGPPEWKAVETDDDVWGGLVGTGEGTIGLSNTGLIGSTDGGYGRGEGAGFGGKGKRVPKVRQAKAQVKGSLDRDIIRRIIRAHINEVRACYNQGLTKDPDLAGRVAIKFVIAPTGKVGSSVVQESTVKDKAVGTCIAKAVKRWKFPKPRDGGKVEVTYPFNLST